VRIDWDGEQTRDYIYVEDVVRANVAALTKGSEATYVVGTGTGTSVNQVYAALVAATGFEAPVTRAEKRAGDVRAILFDPRKAARELGWHAEIPLAEGMRRTVEFFRSREKASA
jgi:UDP-glucose 4-epimerase